jgi:GAF domain-containing protein
MLGGTDVRAHLAWALVGLTTAAVLADTMFTAAYRSLWSEATWADHGWPLAPLASLGCALMGALIVSRHPRHRLGWLLCAASLLSVTLAAEAYSAWTLDGDGPGSDATAHLIAWAAPLIGWPAFTALIMVFLISPDGHTASPRWRWAGWVAIAGLGLHTLGTLATRPGDFVDGEQYHHHGLATLLLTVGYLLVAAGLIASVASLVVRLRRSRDDVRRQLLWIACSAAFLAVGVVVILAVPRLQGEEGTWLAGLPLRLAQLAVPLCVAVAVLRHRLLEIDLIVNRAALVALATGLAAGGYVLVVVVAGRIVGSGGFWPSLLATAVVALAFQPLRQRVVRVADRLAFGAAAAPYEALADFSRRLGESPDPVALLPAVAEAAAHAVSARRAVVVLHVEAGSDLTARWPASDQTSPTASTVDMPVVDRGEQLGFITIEMPPGRPLRPRDHRLLADLADQAGMAFRHARLTAELTGQVEQLRSRTHRLAESRRRLITAGDAERSRLERAIARQVMLHLTPLPERLGQLSHVEPDGSTALDPPMILPLLQSLNVSLEALREITRGVFPAQLGRSGLTASLESLLARRSSPGHLTVEGTAVRRRFDPRVEAAAYFCVAEGARELGGPVRVVLDTVGAELHLRVSGTDDGELPMRHMRDRVEAVGGSVSLVDRDGGVTLDIRAPATPSKRPVAAIVPT